jgi:hypothetical protein
MKRHVSLGIYIMRSTIIVLCYKYYNKQIDEDGIGRTCNAIAEMRNAYKILVGKPEGRRQFGRCGCESEENIKNLTEIGWCCADWINVAHDRDLWAVVKT